MYKLFFYLIDIFTKILRHGLAIIYQKRFKSCGKNVRFNPMDNFSWQTISIGDDVFIGSGAFFSASNSHIKIGSKVMFGPNVTLMGGDHNTASIGQFMYDVKSKKKGDDLPIYIEDDVWVGAGAIILKGVRVKCGSIIAAGAVVTRDVSSYSIVGGIPAKVIGNRFTTEEIYRHEKELMDRKCAE